MQTGVESSALLNRATSRVHWSISFILLPDGVGVVPLFIGAREHTEDEYLRAMEIYHQRVGELAQIGVDLIHPEGGPPFMLRGVDTEKELVQGWQDKYGIPVVTTGMSHCDALRAMGIRRFLGLTPYKALLTTNSPITSRLPVSTWRRCSAYRSILSDAMICPAKRSTVTSKKLFFRIVTSTESIS